MQVEPLPWQAFFLRMQAVWVLQQLVYPVAQAQEAFRLLETYSIAMAAPEAAQPVEARVAEALVGRKAGLDLKALREKWGERTGGPSASASPLLLGG